MSFFQLEAPLLVSFGQVVSRYEFLSTCFEKRLGHSQLISYNKGCLFARMPKMLLQHVFGLLLLVFIDK